MDADGDFVVVWASRSQDDPSDNSSAGYDIFARRYNAAGNAQGSEFRVNSFTTGFQYVPVVAMDAGGDFVVAWQSRGQDDPSDTSPLGDGVFAQRYDAAGSAQGPEFQVNSFTTGSQFGPHIAMDADGDFVVAWQSLGQDGSDWGVFGQRHNATGVPQGPEFQVNTTTTNGQLSPAVAMDADGDFVVAWQSLGQDGSNWGVFARHFLGSPRAAAAGQVSVNHIWKFVPGSAAPALVDPVIILGPPTFHGTQPGVVRLRGVTTGGYQVRFQEWTYLDGPHAAEDLPYTILEAGRQVMADGSVWEAGTFPLGGTAAWQSEVFSQPFAAPPALFLSVQTFDGAQPATVRARNVTATGFEAALFEEEALMDGHVVEDVGYLAVCSAEGSGELVVNGKSVPYLLQSPSVDQRFAPVLSSALKVEEEQSRDAELGHVKETLSVLALGEQIFAQDVSSAGGDTAALRRLAPEYGAPIEWGTVDGVTQDWTTVPLAKSYINPVVVAKPVSANGAQPGVIRVRNVTGGSFELRFQEWLYLDGAHIPERVFYLVAEAGTTNLAGLEVEAGRLSSSLLLGDGFETVTFSTAFFDTPALFTGVMTANGGDPVITRVDGLAPSGFFLTMDEEEAKTDGHITETLGWIAVEPGSGTTGDGRAVAVGQTTANHQPVATPLGLSANRQFPVPWRTSRSSPPSEELSRLAVSACGSGGHRGGWRIDLA
jgi:hypothetical protein